MGCDIHMYAEVYMPEKPDDLDNELNSLMENMGYSGYKKYEKWSKVGNIFQGWSGEPTDHPYTGRNYSLFGVLAGVRGHDQYFPVRDLPVDTSSEVQDLADKYGADGHTHSYIYLGELEHFLESMNFKELEKDLDSGFVNYTMPELRKLGSSKNVRIVFWFDN
jgi:hypothetical protein